MLVQDVKPYCLSLKSCLYHSLINDDEEAVKTFLIQGVDVHMKVKGPLTCIHIAVEKEYLKIIEHLLQKGADANSRYPVTENSYTGSTLLYHAAAKGNEAIVSLLLEYNADVKAENKNKLTALHIAAEKGYLQIVKILLQKGAKVNFENDAYCGKDFYREQFLESKILRNELNIDVADFSHISRYEGAHSPLHLAIKARHENIIQLLFESGADVDALNGHGDTALSLSVQKASLEILDQILYHSPSVNNCGNKRALSYAVEFQGEKHRMVIQKLLQYGFSYDSDLEEYNELLLDTAIRNGHCDIIYKLFDKDGNFFDDAKENRKYATRLLETAVKEGNTYLSNFLLEQGASLKSSFCLSKLFNLKKIHASLVELLIANGLNVREDPKILVHAAQQNMHELIKILLKNRVNVNISVKDEYFIRRNCSYLPFYKVKFSSPKCKISPLFVAAALGDQFSVECFLEYGANINFKTDNGLTPFLMSVIGGHSEVVEILLKSGAEIEATDFDKRTPLYLAAEFGHEKVVKLLLRYGAKIDVRARGYILRGITPFLIAAMKGHLNVIKTLTEVDTHHNIIETADERGKTALFFAAKNGHCSVVNFLLDHGANVNTTDEEGETALFKAAMNGHVGTVKLLLEYGANVRVFNICYKDTPLYYAVKEDQLEVVKLLLEYGADPNITHEFDFDSPLTISAGKGNLKIVDLLIKCGADINYFTPTGETALFSALQNGHTDIVKLLFANGARVSCDKQRNQLLLCCAKKGHFYSMEFLLKDRTEVNFTDCDGQTALHLAAACNHDDIMQLLLNFGCNINALDKKMKTPLTLASEEGHLLIVEVLLKSGADIEAADYLGRTALYVSAENGHNDVLNLLMEYGANKNHKSKNSKTPLIISSERGHFGIVKTLIKSGANVNSYDNDGKAALAFAAEFGHVDAVILLLEHKAKVDIVWDNGTTPLIICSERGHLNCIDHLLKSNANVHHTDERGLTALHYAAEFGHSEIVELLLEHCADIDCESRDDVSLLLICAEKGFYKIVDSLMKFGARFDLTDKPDLTEHLATTLHKWDSKIFTRALEYFSADYKFSSKTNLRSLFKVVNKLDDIDYLMTENEQSNYQSLTKILVRFFTKIRAANLYANKENLVATAYCDETKISSLENKCKAEIGKMMCETIGNSDILVYDLLKINLNRLASFARNRCFLQVLRSSNFKFKFPLYFNIINNQFNKGKIRRRLIDKCGQVCQKSFIHFAPLPSNIVESILLYVSNRDLRSLLASNYPSTNS